MQYSFLLKVTQLFGLWNARVNIPTEQTTPLLKKKKEQNQQIIHIILSTTKSPSVQVGLLQSCHLSPLAGLAPRQQHNPPALISCKTACFEQTDARSSQILQSAIFSQTPQPGSEHQAASYRAGFLKDQEYL